MKKRILAGFVALIMCVAPALSFAASTPAERRAAIHKMESETLAKLYQLKPDTKQEIENSVGYAVFSSGSLAVVWVSGSYGHGIARNKEGKETFMQMASAGLGLGLGAKDFNTVFVFHDTKALNDFVTTGLDLTGHADAAAKLGEKGEAASGSKDVLPGVNIYQITDTGLIAQLMLQGTKYWRDDELNNSK